MPDRYSSIVQRNGGPRLLETGQTRADTVLTMYDGRGKKSLGTCSLEVVSKEGQEVRLKFEVLDTNKLTLLSLDTSLKLRLISYEAEEVCVVDEYQRFTKEQIRQQYPEVFKGIGALPGEYDIILDETVPPVQHRPRKIPLSMKAAVEEKLQQLEEKGVIARVDQPTDWISNLTAVWKADKKQVRVCLDPQELNKAVKINHYNMPTLDDVLPQLAQAKTFSLLDAKDGFLQVKLSERSSYYTTFWGPQARYRWLRMPFGLSSAPEEFQRRLQETLHGLDGVSVVADDALVYGCGETDTEAWRDHDENLRRVMDRAQEKNLKFNYDKMRLHLTDLPYIGHRLTPEGVKPDPAKMAAIQEMAEPKTPQEVRRFLGMVNYLAKFLPNLSQVTEPLRKLTQKEEEFKWGKEEEVTFRTVKSMLCSEDVLAYFDAQKEIVIQCDASTKGLGATLLQNGRPVASTSRALTKSEKNYVAIELECLAIVFACKKFDQYIYGRKATVETDHRALEIITKKSLLSAPKRLQRMLLELQRYDLDVRYRPGEEQCIADTLSRAPLDQSWEELSEEEVFQLATLESAEHEIEHTSSREHVRVGDERMEAVMREARKDEEQKTLREWICKGWPTRRSEVPEKCWSYWNFRDTLTVENGIVYKGDQVVIPKTLRPEILQRLHGSHQGYESTLRRARDAVY